MVSDDERGHVKGDRLDKMEHSKGFGEKGIYLLNVGGDFVQYLVVATTSASMRGYMYSRRVCVIVYKPLLRLRACNGPPGTSNDSR